MDSNPLDGLINRMGWINNDAAFEGPWDGFLHLYLTPRDRDGLRALLAVVKATKQLAEGDRAAHDPHGDAYLAAMSTAAEVPHGQ